MFRSRAAFTTAAVSWVVLPGAMVPNTIGLPSTTSCMPAMPESVRATQAIAVLTALPSQRNRRASYCTPAAPSACCSTSASLKVTTIVPSLGSTL
jgi:hypothetical protein